ncbi:hypothetical protein N7501_008578 [Penicillium viridicatum]|nr:hypothetical protein N7501_008578 [Penicillium viridicatum]
MPSNESSTPQHVTVSIPDKGLSDEVVGELLQKHMAADIPPSHDLGRFTTTKFDETAINIMVAGSLRNQPCIEEYPSLADFREKCVSMLANLWNAPSGFFGAATTGSSEAVLLGGLAMKRQWQLQHPSHLNSRPNVLIGANAHICVNKVANYFDVEARIIPVIGVFLTLGSTYTGHYDPIQQVSRVLDEYEHQTGNNIPIHVDAASGGFIAPFTPSNTNFIW